MKKLKSILLISLLVSLLTISACVPATPGLDIHGYQFQQIPGHELRIPMAGAGVNAHWVRDNGYNSYPNLLTNFVATLGDTGWTHVNNVRLPAEWNFSYVPRTPSHPCSGLSWQFDLEDSDLVILPCQYFGHVFGLTVIPLAADAQAMPATFTAIGEGINGTYGTPMVEFFDEYGRQVATVYATSVNTTAAGPTLTGTTPYLPYNSCYVLIVSSVLADGTYDVGGVSTLVVSNGAELPRCLSLLLHLIRIPVSPTHTTYNWYVLT